MAQRTPPLSVRIEPKTTALLVVDMQNDFVSPSGANSRWITQRWAAEGSKVTGFDRMTSEVVPAIKELINAARQVGVPVVWVRTVNDEMTNARFWVSENQILCQPGTWGAEFASGLQPTSDELVITKTRHSAFFGTHLNSVLQLNSIEGVIATGTATHGCVEGTVRDAMAFDYWAVVPRDCCGQGDLEAHEIALTRIDRLFGMVSDSQTIMTTWQAAEESGM